MAAKSGGSENMTRLGMAIIDEYTQILRDILSMHIPQAQLYHDVKAKNIRLRPEQETLVAKAKMAGYANFDITLLYSLIRNLSLKIPKPTRGWGDNSGPGPGDITLGDDIERIRILRNVIYGHIPSTFISDADFRTYWSEITDVCKRMEKTAGGNYVKHIIELETCIIDEHTEQKYQKMIESERQVKEGISAMKEDIRAVHEDIKDLKEWFKEPKPREENPRTSIKVTPSCMWSHNDKQNFYEEIVCENINRIIEEIDENTPKENIFGLLDEILKLDDSSNMSDTVVHFIFKLKAKVNWYNSVNKSAGTEVMLKFIQVTIKLKARYNLKSISTGSLIFNFEFHSEAVSSRYQSDFDSGILKRLLSEVLLFPAFLSLLGLSMNEVNLEVEKVPEVIISEGRQQVDVQSGEQDTQSIGRSVPSITSNRYSATSKMASSDPMAQDVIRCDLCIKAVELHCNPCQVNLCEGCVSKHIISQKSKKHEVVPFRERKSDTNYPKCSSHADEKCDFFCKKCNTHICSKCVTGSHKKHKFVNLDDYMIVQSKKSFITEENKELEKYIIPIYERNEANIVENITSLLKQYAAIDSQIVENGKKWHKEIDIVVQRHRSEVNEMKTKDIQTMKSQQTALRDMLQIACDTLQTNKRLLQTSDVNEIKNYKSRIEKLRKFPTRTILTCPSFTALRIEGDNLYRQFGKLHAAIESEISAFKVKKNEKPHVINTTDSTKTPLWGLTYVPGEKFWISGKDATIDLLDTQGTVLETVSTLSGEKPDGLAITRDGDLLYCDASTESVNMIKNGTTTTIIRTPGWRPNGVCSTSSGGLIVIMATKDVTRDRIVKYDVDYNEVLSVENDENDKPLLAAGKNSNYLAENKNLDICIADVNGSSIIVLDQNGKYRWRYSGNLGAKRYEKFYPRGITTDSQGHIIAADRNNHCLHVIDQNGQFICYIDNCGLEFPVLLSVDDDDLLYVGEYKKYKKLKAQVQVVKYLQ